jgi:hypothetical protein
MDLMRTIYEADGNYVTTIPSETDVGRKGMGPDRKPMGILLEGVRNLAYESDRVPVGIRYEAQRNHVGIQEDSSRTLEESDGN